MPQMRVKMVLNLLSALATEAWSRAMVAYSASSLLLELQFPSSRFCSLSKLVIMRVICMSGFVLTPI